MKKFENNEVERIYIIDGDEYKVEKEKEIAVGKVVYDSRTDQFKLMETNEDCARMFYLAPELFATLKKVKRNHK